jgi:DNA-binding MarR family transcriptional regulator
MTDGQRLNGQDIGEAQRATRALLDRLLAETDTTFPAWVTLNVLATSGGALPAEDVVHQVSSGLRIDEPPVQMTLADLLDGGLVVAASDGSSTVRLTPAGDARYQQVQAGIARISERLYGDLPATDLATAHRVLATVTERANAELASST